jgi:hypothetical protein
MLNGVSAFDWAEVPNPIRIYIRTVDLLDGIWTLRLWNTKQELRALVLDYWFLCSTVINILGWRIQWGTAWQICSLVAAGHRGHLDTTSIDICWTRVTEQWLMVMLTAMESWVRSLYFKRMLLGSRIGAQITQGRKVIRNFRLPPRSRWELCSSGLLCSE